MSSFFPSIVDERKRTAWRYVCVAHSVRCLADRSFSFFLPLYLSRQCPNPTLRPTAALSLVQNSAVALLSTTVVRLYKANAARGRESRGRTRISPLTTTTYSSSFAIATLSENAAVAFVGVFVYLYLRDDDDDGDGETSRSDRCDRPLSSNYFRLALICGSVDAIFSSLLSMVISKEWVASLFRPSSSKDHDDDDDGEKGRDRPLEMRNRLAKANAVLSQIDLVVGAVCPLVVSRLISWYGYHFVLAVLVSQHLVGAMVVAACATRAIRACPFLVDAGATTTTTTETRGDGVVARSSRRRSIEGGDDSFPRLFAAQSVRTRLVSASYVLLYFTVLSPGAMLHSWINSSRRDDANETTIALFGSASQLCGALATLVAPTLIARMGSLARASAASQWFQTICVLYGFLCFRRLHRADDSEEEEENGRSSTLMLGFLASVGVSRIGLWSFDLVERQVLQESVPSFQQTLFFNGEKSVAQLFSLGMMVLCYAFPDPDSFHVLVACSVLAVTSSSIIILVMLMISK